MRESVRSASFKERRSAEGLERRHKPAKVEKGYDPSVQTLLVETRCVKTCPQFPVISGIFFFQATHRMACGRWVRRCGSVQSCE